MCVSPGMHAATRFVGAPLPCLSPHRCPPLEAGGVCTSQESSLALLWTLGIFTLNCGPVVMGVVLDFLGPKLTGILGAQRPPRPSCPLASSVPAAAWVGQSMRERCPRPR